MAMTSLDSRKRWRAGQWYQRWIRDIVRIKKSSVSPVTVVDSNLHEKSNRADETD